MLCLEDRIKLADEIKFINININKYEKVEREM